jgi:two-component system OmpR family sensor kinase
MRVLPRTLRGRLIAGLLALLTAACATVGLVTYLAVQRSLAGELTNDLQTATGLAYQCYNPGAPAPDNDHGYNTPAADNQQADDSSQSEKSSPDPDASPPADGSGPAGPTSLPTILPKCQGLDEGTFVAILWHGSGRSALISSSTTTLSALSAADLKTLLGIPPWKPPDPAEASNGENIPTHSQYLSEPGGTFLLTALSDPDGDGSVYITGVPLSTLQDMLREVALVEAAVFGAVLVLAGVLGTFLVRFSLRPLRRVAATATQVAELPLESGEVSLPAGVPDTDPATETGQVGLAFNRMLGHVQTALRRRAASEARLRRFAAAAPSARGRASG